MSAEGQHLLLHAYLDGELDPATTIATRAAIESDPRLAAELAAAAALQRTLRARFPREAPPDALVARISAIRGNHARWSRPSWTALAACVLLAVSLSSSLTWLTSRAGTDDRVIAAAVDSHLRSLIASKPMEVTTSERHVIKPWFNGRIPQAPRVIDLKPEGFPLVGARIDVIETTPVPALVYMRRLHTISLVALPALDIRNTRMRTGNGYNVVTWTDGRTSYIATSDLNAQELDQFAAMFRAAED
jgi:anti-sigma factor RsiW